MNNYHHLHKPYGESQTDIWSKFSKVASILGSPFCEIQCPMHRITYPQFQPKSGGAVSTQRCSKNVRVQCIERPKTRHLKLMDLIGS